MKNAKGNDNKSIRWGASIVLCVAVIMIFAAFMPLAMAGKPDKPPVTSDFKLTTLDSHGIVGEYPRIVVGGAPDNWVHITYYDSTNHALKYATNKGGWTVQTVATVGNRFYYPTGGVADLALDDNGKVHIIYVDSTKNNELEYVNNVAGSWSIPTPLLTSKDVMGQPCLAIDSAGKFHVSFWQSDSEGNWITYSYGLLGAIVSTRVVYGDNSQAFSWYTSMAVDSNNVAHMIYINLNTYVLTYTNSLDWTKKVELTGVDIWANIAIGQGNSVHLSYFTYPNRALNYAVLSGSSFTSTLLDNTVDSGSHRSSIAIDSSGWVHIGYMDYPAGSNKPIVKYATNVGGSWNTKLVDGSSNAGSDNDIAIGSDGYARIAYYYPGNSDLKYAISV